MSNAIPPGRTPCPFPRVVPACCRTPQRPIEGPIPPPIELGQWRRPDPAKALELGVYPFVRVVSEDRGTADPPGHPVFVVECYDASLVHRDSMTLHGPTVTRVWAEVLPGKPEAPAEASTSPTPPTARRAPGRGVVRLLTLSLALAALAGVDVSPPARRGR